MAIYFDSEKNLRKELLDGDALVAAQGFMNPTDRSKPITSAQLRKFYNEFKGLEKKLQSKSNSIEKSTAFKVILPLVKMVRSKVEYASNPKNQKVPTAFKAWLTDNVNSINEVRDFEAFLLHFEAVVGFCYGMGLKS